MRKIKKASLLLCLAMAALTGCGKKSKNVDYSIESENTGTVTDASKTGGNGLSDIDTTDGWRTTFDVNSEVVDQIKIAAQITLPDTDTLAVVSMEEPEFDAGYKKSLAEALYGNNTVYIYGMEAPTKADIEAELQKIPNILADDYDAEDSLNENEGYYDDKDYWQSMVQDTQDEIAFYEGKQAEYEAMLETASEDRVEATDFSEKNYVGERNGISYVLSFSDSRIKDENTYDSAMIFDGYSRTKHIEMYPEDYHTVCSDVMQEAQDVSCWAGEDTGDNSCSLTEAEAQQIAQQFLNSLGFSDLELAETGALAWFGDWTDDEGYAQTDTDGYAFTFRHNVNNVWLYGNNTIFWYTYMEACTDEGIEADQYDLGTEARVFVNDNGVVYMDYANPLMETKVVDDVTILPLENIEDIMIEELQNNCDQYILSASSANGSMKQLYYMALIYFRLQDDAGDSNQYSYVPAWILSADDSSDIAGSCLVVNAIDGSIINVAKEIYNSGL
jgi:hypothetical protein